MTFESAMVTPPIESPKKKKKKKKETRKIDCNKKQPLTWRIIEECVGKLKKHKKETEK